MALRAYQHEALEGIRKGFLEFSRQVAILPTGGGKTVVFSRLAADLQPARTRTWKWGTTVPRSMRPWWSARSRA
jgi:superfamily II DNA or RNA helicase